MYIIGLQQQQQGCGYAHMTPPPAHARPSTGEVANWVFCKLQGVAVVRQAWLPVP